MSHARRRSHLRHAPDPSSHHGEESFWHSVMGRPSVTAIWRAGVIYDCSRARLWHPNIDSWHRVCDRGGLSRLFRLFSVPSGGAVYCAGSISGCQRIIFHITTRRAPVGVVSGAFRRPHRKAIRCVGTIIGALGTDHAVHHPCRAGHPCLYDSVRRHLRLDVSPFRYLDGGLFTDLGLWLRAAGL